MQALKDFIFRYNIITVLVILVLTWISARLASKLMSKKVLALLPAKLTKKEKAQFSASQYTRLKMAKRLVLLLIYAVGISIALLQIDTLRTLGTALLASAGFIGLIAGLAARDSLSNLIAGVTIAFAQPIRLNDYVNVENEYGQVEELTLLYTIIRTWDNRRLIVPNTKIVSSPLRNYSFGNQDILAEVTLLMPYEADVPRLKNIIKKIVKDNPHYLAKKEPETIVTDLGEELVELKVKALAKDSQSAGALSNEIREKILFEFKKEGIPLGKAKI